MYACVCERVRVSVCVCQTDRAMCTASVCVCVCCRLFGATGNCAACSKLIPAFEMVMRAKDNVYHLDCFACQLCSQR